MKMNCIRVLQLFSHSQSAVTPVELAKCLTQPRSLSQIVSTVPPESNEISPPRSMSPRRDSIQIARPSSSPPISTVSEAPRKLQSCLRKPGKSLMKKRVAFADSVGLSLTMVFCFNPDPPYTEETEDLINQVERPSIAFQRIMPVKFQLGFHPPAQNFQYFMARLRKQNVLLESCCILENNLKGKVWTSHFSKEKTVHVRLTYDSWRSHRDFPCQFVLNQICCGLAMDVFTFNIELPANIDPMETTEFCIAFRPRACCSLIWDTNNGLRYKVCVERHALSASQRQPAVEVVKPSIFGQFSGFTQSVTDIQNAQSSFYSRYSHANPYSPRGNGGIQWQASQQSQFSCS